MELNIKDVKCSACGGAVAGSLEVKRNMALVREKYRKHSGARGSRSGSLFASEAMFLLAGAMTLLALFYDRVYAHAPFAALSEEFRASSMSPSAVTNMIADNLFIIVAPVAVLFLVSQTLLLHQIRRNVSYKR